MHCSWAYFQHWNYARLMGKPEAPPQHRTRHAFRTLRRIIYNPFPNIVPAATEAAVFYSSPGRKSLMRHERNYPTRRSSAAIAFDAATPAAVFLGGASESSQPINWKYTFSMSMAIFCH